MERRKFIKNAGGFFGGMTIGASAMAANKKDSFNELTLVPGKIPQRKIISTDTPISIVGFPGNALRQYDQDETNEAVQWSIGQGVNYFDVAPAYGKDGEAEIKLGNALSQIDRNKFFLANKTKKRDKDGAMKELETSLKRLKTDHFDLYQMHILQTLDEVEEAFGPGGCMEVFEQAKKDGVIKHLGFSAHTSLAGLAAMDKYRFDTVMFPVNFVEHFTFAFGQAILEKAHNQGVSVLTIKSTSGGAWPETVSREERDWWFRVLRDEPILNMAIRFALSQRNVTSLVPASFFPHYKATVDLAKSFSPITDEEMEKLRELAKTSQSLFFMNQSRGMAFNHAHAHDEEEMC